MIAWPSPRRAIGKNDDLRELLKFKACADPACLACAHNRRAIDIWSARARHAEAEAPPIGRRDELTYVVRVVAEILYLALVGIPAFAIGAAAGHFLWPSP